MAKEITKITINTPFLTLGQLLKLEKVVFTGGAVKEFLASHKVLVNDIPDNRRGRKLYNGDKIKVDDKDFEIVEK